jgi:hypothetical protein
MDEPKRILEPCLIKSRGVGSRLGGRVSIHGAQSECRAMESASQDWDFDQRASDAHLR